MQPLPKPLPDPPNSLNRHNGKAVLPTRKRSLPVKSIVYGIGGILAAGLLTWMLRPAPILVEVSSVQRGDLQVTVNVEGKTRVRDRYTITAPVNGHLDRILLQEGDPVETGQLVARIDPLPLQSSVQEALGRLAEWRAQRQGVATQRPKSETIAQARTRILAAEANQRQAEARVAAAQAALAQAQRDRDRATQLAASGAISRQDRETAELTAINRAKELDAIRMAAKATAAEVEVARSTLAVVQQEQSDPDYLLKVYDARIASTEAELARLRDSAARTEIRSPVKGRVLRIQQKSAQFISEGTSLLEIGDPSQLELVIDVLSRDAEVIRPGDPILLDQSLAAARAVVQRVEPSAFTKVSALGVEEQRVNVIGRFLDAARPFGDAYRVDTRIVVWEGKNVLQVPLSSLFRCQKTRWCVFTVQDDKAHQQWVELGQRNDRAAEIRQGLQPDQRVILHPSEQLQDGRAVKVRSASDHE